MIRAAALASGEGEKLQAVLDAMYFGELPDFELAAVICPEKNAYVMQRALNARIPAYVVDPDLFPTMTTHSMAVANKLKDMDVELVLLADYDASLGVIPYQFKNRIIGTWPSLCPAFEDCEGDVFEAVLARGCTLTGATSFFADADGRVGKIIDQRAVAVLPGDTAETLRRRVTEQAEWPLLAEAVKHYCQGVLRV
ncbi:MAG: phosphoribosylglycinamide formyltransferase [Oscillospiraceae bacterium]|nr:phosphoribosylglycinamide formyltransferase [Oscillospiraceae bacterium]